MQVHATSEKSGSASFVNGRKKQPFFAPAFVQPKLTVGPVDDPYEREADAMAETVMRMTDVQAISTNPSPLIIQKKCEACEEEEKLRRKEDEDESVLQMKPMADFIVQRKCPDCEEEQKKNALQLKPVAGHAIQKKCAECEKEDEEVHRKESANAIPSVSPSVHQTLRSTGHGLDTETRSFMEQRFGYDFSHVQIHNDSLAHQSSADIRAKAYTHGHHIVFAAGQYQPGNHSGKELLAHELTHVIQQNGFEYQKKAEINSSPALNSIQRAYWTEPGDMRKRRRVSFKTGDEIHDEVLTDMGESNTDLFTEAPVPEANALGSAFGQDKQGSADLYKASTTVGVKFLGHLKPDFLPDLKGVKLGKNKYQHDSKAAPLFANGVVDLHNAPDEIKVGDLKPYGHFIKDTEFQQQVFAYQDGFKNAKEGIDDMGKDAEAAKLLKPVGGNWPISKSNIKTLDKDDIKIPEQYKIGSSTAPLRTLVLVNNGKPYITDRKVTGRLYLAYRNDQQGIWNYVYVPEQPFQASQIPDNIAAMQVDLNALVTPLRDTRIQPKINHDVTPINKSSSLKPTNKSVTRFIIQRKDEEPTVNKDKFSYNDWEVKHKDFIAKYKAIPQKDKDEAETVIAEEKTQHDLSSKFGFPDVEETGKQKENDKLFKRIKFWAHPLSSVIGRLRQIFGTAFVKIYGGIEKLKEFVKGLIAKLNAPDGGGIIGAVVKIVVKVFKFVGQYFFNKTVGLILGAIKDGVVKKLVSFIESLIPDDVEAFIKDMQGMEEKFKESVIMEVAEIVEKLVGPYKEVFETIDYIRSIADKAEEIISWIRWGARLLACASPPAIGCLWALAGDLIERMAAKIVTSCRVMHTIGPKIAHYVQGIERVKNIPIEVARFVIEKINSFLPDGWQDTFPLPPLSDLSAFDSDYKEECNDGGSGDPITEERQRMLETITEIGDEKFKAFLEMMNKRGAGQWVLLTAERLKSVAEDLKKISTEDLKKIAESKTPEDGIPGTLADLIKDISKYTKQEQDTKAEYFEEKEKKDGAKRLQKIRNAQFPSREKQLSDLKKIDWSTVVAKQYIFVKIGNDEIVYGKTNDGKRVGAYFRTIEEKSKDQTLRRIVSVSPFINLDSIACGDSLGVAFVGEDKVKIFTALYICASDDPIYLKAEQGLDPDESDYFIGLGISYPDDKTTTAVQKKASAGSGSNNVSLVYQALQSGGHQLDNGTRIFMEQRFGTDFSHVQVHDDAMAHQSSSDINALAYTHGGHIVFGKNQYSPYTQEGKKLIAHELTHVLQQKDSNKNIQRKTLKEHGDLTQIPIDVVAACDQVGDLAPGLSVEQKIDGVQYALDSDKIDPSIVKALIEFARQWNSRGGKEKVDIFGYASTDGTDEYNWRLSCRRANSVKNILLRPTDKKTLGIREDFIETHAQGETNKFGSDDTDYIPNRVATIVSSIPLKPSVVCPPCPSYDRPAGCEPCPLVLPDVPLPDKPPGPLKPPDTPFAFCLAYAEIAQARRDHIMIRAMMEAFTAKFGTDVQTLWMNYLDNPKKGTKGTLPPRKIFEDQKGRIVKEFREDQETVKQKNRIMQLIADRVKADPKLMPAVGQSTPEMHFRPLLGDADLLHLDMTFKDGFNRIPGLIAGGYDPKGVDSDAGPDIRQADGTFIATNVGLSTIKIRAGFVFEVFDTIDFCPGNPGGFLAERVTIAMSRFEATPDFPTYDIPFEVIYGLTDEQSF